MRKIFHRILLLAAAVLAVCAAMAQMQPLPLDQGSTGLSLALRKLPVVSSVLHITAHPDDEDNALLMMLSRGRGIRTGLLTLTRGDGGQNEIGPELFEALGIIRTGELMSMHRYDDTRQFFTRAYEFGYSFSVDETFEKWGKEEILADVVYVIRKFRPDVILTLPRGGTGGGQHHQASALLAHEAFRAAADPDRFPEQLAQGLVPWQAGKLYERIGWLGDAAKDGRPPVEMRSSIFDPLLGKTYYELGMEARALHRCQGMSQLVPLPGNYSSRWHLVESVVPSSSRENDLMDGIDTTLFAIGSYVRKAGGQVPGLHEDLEAVQQVIQTAALSFEGVSPHRIVAPLARGLKLVRGLQVKVQNSELAPFHKNHTLFLLNHKEEDFLRALQKASQLRMQAIVDDGTVVAGQEFELTVNLSNDGPKQVELDEMRVRTPPGWQVHPASNAVSRLEGHQVLEQKYRVKVSRDAELTRPYWTREDKTIDRFIINRPENRAEPWSPPPVTVQLIYKADGVPARLQQAAEYRYEGPWVGGEQRHELMVVPLVSLRVSPDISILPLSQTRSGREIRVTAFHHGQDPLSGSVSLDLPDGWSASPSEAGYSFDRENQSIAKIFHLTPPPDARAGEFEIGVTGDFQQKAFREGHQLIDYDHIQKRLLYHPASSVVKTVPVKVASGIRLGYIEGVGDYVPEALSQLGVDYTLLTADDLAFGDLSGYDVIVTGIRAYLNREDLKAHNSRLLDWTRNGGVMIVQYNKFELNGPDSNTRWSPYAPFPLRVGRGRVTDEDAAVNVLKPNHQVFNRPNRIDAEDWSGWVQERGLYFLGDKSEQYVDLVSMEDPFEYNAGEKLGSLVITDYGEGKWLYVGLGLWRQLPAGVPGAYRLLANLVSLPEVDRRD